MYCSVRLPGPRDGEANKFLALKQLTVSQSATYR